MDEWLGLTASSVVVWTRPSFDDAGACAVERGIDVRSPTISVLLLSLVVVFVFVLVVSSCDRVISPINSCVWCGREGEGDERYNPHAHGDRCETPPRAFAKMTSTSLVSSLPS